MLVQSPFFKVGGATPLEMYAKQLNILTTIGLL